MFRQCGHYVQQKPRFRLAPIHATTPATNTSVRIEDLPQNILKDPTFTEFLQSIRNFNTAILVLLFFTPFQNQQKIHNPFQLITRNKLFYVLLIKVVFMMKTFEVF
jgi:hypothetical protein